MDHVQITKTGFVSTYGSEGEPTGNPCSSLSALRCECSIADGVTVGDIFRAVEKDPDLPRLLAHYSLCPDIGEFHELAKAKPTGKSNLKSVQITFCMDVTEGHCGGVYPNVSGIGCDGDVYGLSFVPVNDLAPLPVQIVPRLTVFEFDGDKQDREMSYYPTLLEVLDAIYWEISFYGGPEETEKVGQAVRQDLYELDLEDGE